MLLYDVQTERRFWKKVDISPYSADCWLWKGARSRNGGWPKSGESVYGRFRVNRTTVKAAHIVAWEITYKKPFPKKKLGCHTCDNGLCVRPTHVKPGTHKKNMRDVARRGRRKGRAPMKQASLFETPLVPGMKVRFRFQRYAETGEIVGTIPKDADAREILYKKLGLKPSWCSSAQAINRMSDRLVIRVHRTNVRGYSRDVYRCPPMKGTMIEILKET